MKKLVIASVLFGILAIATFVAAVVYSFTTVLPTTQAINEELAAYFSKVIYIPKGILPPIQDYSQTIYLWEMETPDHEVIGVRLKHDTAFAKDQNTIQLTLEKEEKGDASIFNKVLPAVIADQQSLHSAQDPQKANLAANPQVGYADIKLAVLPQTNQTTQVVWEFDKSTLPESLRSKYAKIEKFPKPVEKFLYSLPHFILSVFSS